VIPGLGGVILVILRRGLALKEERIAKWYNEGGANYWCPMGRIYVRYLNGTLKRIPSLV
jgi:hypothetical protein